MKRSGRIVVIGAGSVGANLALFLDAWGFEVDLVEATGDILEGAARASFINHSDGLEYYKRGHRRTGEYCIEGSLAKAMIYPQAAITTTVCSPQNPIRFLVSEGSLRSRRISLRGFIENAEHMTRHYAAKFHALRRSAGLTEQQAVDIFLRPPQSVVRPLAKEEFADVDGIAGGVNGGGAGINMPRYYALLKAALGQSRIRCHFGAKVERLAKLGHSGYEVRAGGLALPADQVLICSSHSMPELARKIDGAVLPNAFAGTYYLNSMSFLRLPATRSAETLRRASRINFTLMEKFGCMYACIVPPTPSGDGMAAIYFPDPSGSQRLSHVCARGEVSRPPPAWQALLDGGLDNGDPNVVATFEQACRVYPFLAGYADVTHTICRTVFNVAVKDSNHGLDRRVRELSAGRHALTGDGRISAWTAPKWTNAELTALMALDYALQSSGGAPLPKDPDSGCGPTQLDVAKICKRLNFRQVVPDMAAARRYARLSAIPERILQAAPGER